MPARYFSRTRPLLLADETSQHETNVRRSLAQSSHEVRKPFLAERHVHAERIALPGQRRLKVAANAVLLTDAETDGVYIGNPARKFERK